MVPGPLGFAGEVDGVLVGTKDLQEEADVAVERARIEAACGTETRRKGREDGGSTERASPDAAPPRGCGAGPSESEVKRVGEAESLFSSCLDPKERKLRRAWAREYYEA